VLNNTNWQLQSHLRQRYWFLDSTLCWVKQVGIGCEFLIGWRRSRRNLIRWYNWKWAHVVWIAVGINDRQGRSTWFRRRRFRQTRQIADRLWLISNRDRTCNDFLDNTIVVAGHRRIQHQTIRPRQTEARGQAEAAARHPRRYAVVRVVYWQFLDEAGKIVLYGELHKFIASQVSGFEIFVRFFVHVLRLIIRKFNCLWLYTDTHCNVITMVTVYFNVTVTNTVS